jgi:uncharacterized membrane-anchored protein YitT (DUF2179 family)
MIKNGIKVFSYNTLLLLFGGAICAISVNGILIPSEFLSSGMTGFALIIFYKYSAIPVGVIYLLINIPVFVLGWFFVGLRFVLYSMWGMAIYTAMLFLLDFSLGINDNMLNAFIAGGLNGIGVAVMLRSSGAPGGSEIICVVLNKFFSITLGAGSIIINAVVLLLSSLLFPVENVLYTLIYIFISGRVTDMVFHGLSKRQAALIVSDKWEEILFELNYIHKVGVTLLKGQGGYLGDDKTVLYSVINRKTVSALKKTVMEIDQKAFIAIMSASDVTGVEVGNQPHW